MNYIHANRLAPFAGLSKLIGCAVAFFAVYNLTNAQLHFSSPITVTRAELHTGSAAVDEKIDAFFDGNPGYSLSTNVEWIPGADTARLDGGVPSISQNFTITVGNELVANRVRQHLFEFSLEAVRNAEGDYSIRLKWTITDNSTTEPVTVNGTKSLYRVLKSSPGSRVIPEQLQGENSDEVIFRFGNTMNSGSGSWVYVSLPATRAYWRDDHTLVVEGYTVKVQTWIPSSADNSGQNAE